MEALMAEPIAVCGLDCGGCDIQRIAFDAAAAERIVAWFREMEWLAEGEGVQEITERGMYCQGCRGDRGVHWSADCPILVCCVDERGLESCADCDACPCAQLTDRARENTGYADALQRLLEMR